MAILGIIIAALGVVLILLGVVGAARKVLMEEGKAFSSEAPATFDFAGLAKVIEAVLKAPPWLLMVLFGAALVFLGYRLGVGGWPFA